MPSFQLQDFPKTRIATIDIGAIAKTKHHIPALLEMDVSHCRNLLKTYRKGKDNISFVAWLIKVVAYTIKNHEWMSGYLHGKHKVKIFNDINISFLIEKEIDGIRVPMPLLIEKVDERSLEWITQTLHEAKNQKLGNKDIVLQKKSTRLQRLYYHLPGCLRRSVWRLLLSRPAWAFSSMGNVSITALGMAGKINGWFIPLSVHPLNLGIGSIISKPLVIQDKIEIRDVLHLTVLMDHDVVDGIPMAHFIRELTKNIEGGLFLNPGKAT